MPRVHRYPTVAVIGIVGALIWSTVATVKQSKQTKLLEQAELRDSFNLTPTEVAKINHRIDTHVVSIKSILDSLRADKNAKMALEKTGQLLKKNF